MNSNTLKICDIFCGAGGLSYGFAKEKCFEIVFACDNDKSAIASYQANHPRTKTIHKDISELDSTDLKEFAPVDILLGGPPCQSYSTLGKRQMDKRCALAGRAQDDKRLALMFWGALLFFGEISG